MDSNVVNSVSGKYVIVKYEYQFYTVTQVSVTLTVLEEKEILCRLKGQLP